MEIKEKEWNDFCIKEEKNYIYGENMELVPIIYNSLLIVFSIISLILLTSFFCSKVLFCGTKKEEFEKKKSAIPATVPSSRTIKVLRGQEIRKHKHNHSHSTVNKTLNREKKLLVNNKVRVISKPAGFLAEEVKPATRFSIVNQTPREKKYNGDLYTKFSKMSVEYTQSI